MKDKLDFTKMEETLAMNWDELVRLGVEKSVVNGITLSVFKSICGVVFPEQDFENDDWDNEDYWTFRFESWCMEIMCWRDGYPINKSTCFEWAEGHSKDIDWDE